MGFLSVSVHLLSFLIVSKFEGRADALRAVEALGTDQAHDSCLLIYIPFCLLCTVSVSPPSPPVFPVWLSLARSCNGCSLFLPTWKCAIKKNRRNFRSS